MLESGGVIVPKKGLQDGKWEVGGALGAAEVEEEGKERELELVSSMREALRSSLERLGGLKEVRCMDVWWGTFKKETEEEL